MLRLRDSTPRSASLATLQSNALSMAAEELSVLTVVSLLTSPQTVTLSSTALRELDTLPRLTSQLWELPRSKLRDNDLPLESEQLRVPIEISRWGTNTWNHKFEGARLKAVLCAPVNLEMPQKSSCMDASKMSHCCHEYSWLQNCVHASSYLGFVFSLFSKIIINSFLFSL